MDLNEHWAFLKEHVPMCRALTLVVHFASASSSFLPTWEVDLLPGLPSSLAPATTQSIECFFSLVHKLDPSYAHAG